MESMSFDSGQCLYALLMQMPLLEIEHFKAADLEEESPRNGCFINYVFENLARRIICAQSSSSFPRSDMEDPSFSTTDSTTATLSIQLKRQET